MERQDKEQQNEGHGNEKQQNEVECCEIEDDLLFYGLLEDHGWNYNTRNTISFSVSKIPNIYLMTLNIFF